jgi:serine phosphatase RsbU (regulator of sigma subunit)
MEPPDYAKPVKITEHVYWVGTYDPSDKFQCNSYLIVLNGKGIIIDPGSTLYFQSFINKVTQLVELKNISHIILQHQDPDVCGNIARLSDAIRSSGNSSCKIVTHSRTSALVRHYGKNLTFEHSNKLPEQRYILEGGSELKFIHTPYLHAPGAISTYFSTDRILFSGDLFGGETRDWKLFADENYFDEITSFHQEYMPSKELLLFAMTKFERLPMELIAPQHGSVIHGEQAMSLIEAFKDFECGLFIDQSFREELRAAQQKIEEQNRIMNAELAMAAHFQRTLLPDDSILSANRGLDIAYMFKPYSQVSGDFLIIDEIDDQRLGILVIDVVDHGVTAGLTTMQVRTLFDEYKKSSINPATILRKINDRAFNLDDHDVFLTASYAVYDSGQSRISIASAAGVPVIHYQGNSGAKRIISLISNPIGLCKGEECKFLEKSFTLEENDFIILQTDGLIDCANDKNEPFERLKSLKKFTDQIDKGKSAQQVLDSIIQAANKHKGEDRDFGDDVTIVVVKKTK